MLYNRFSAIAVAIYLDPGNVRHRLSLARRYVNFKDTDEETRRACIRGAMHLAILLRHLGLPLTDILEWLTDITNVLVDEYEQGTKKDVSASHQSGAVVGVQLVLGCVRKIFEKSTMNPNETGKSYPDPALLEGRKPLRSNR